MRSDGGPPPTYTDPALVSAIRSCSRPPVCPSASGYGHKILTRYLVRYLGRWRRVYMIQYGNAGSPYIIVHDAEVFLDTDTEHALVALGDDETVAVDE